MGELIINKLVFYSKNSMRIRFKILNLIRGMILKFYNPIVKVQIIYEFFSSIAIIFGSAYFI